MNSDSPNTADIVERLHARTTNDGLGDPDDDLINPDGPEAAAIITELREALEFVEPLIKVGGVTRSQQIEAWDRIAAALKDHRKAQA